MGLSPLLAMTLPPPSSFLFNTSAVGFSPQMDCNLEKVQALKFTLPLQKMVAFLDEAAKNDAEAARMLRALGRPVLEVGKSPRPKLSCTRTLPQ